VRRFAIGLAVGLAFAGGVALGGQWIAPGAGVITDQAGHNLRLIGAVARVNKSGVWQLLTTAGHLSLGIERVSCRPNGKLAFYLQPAAAGVTSVWADADDAYATAGVTVGASVALDRIDVRFARYGGERTSPVHCRSTQLRIESANVWVGGIFTMPAPEPTPEPTPTEELEPTQTPELIPTQPVPTLEDPDADVMRWEAAA
jgi:hypothetical protein